MIQRKSTLTFFMLTCLLVGACSAGAKETPTATAPILTPQLTQQTVPSNTLKAAPIATTAAIAVVPKLANKTRVLTWNPNAGQLALYADSEAPIILESNLSSNSVVLNCGGSASGESVVTYIGGDTAQPVIYPLGGGSAIPLGETIGLTCTIQNRFQFSPDGTRLGLILYDKDVIRNSYTTGSLRILDSKSGDLLIDADQATAFSLYNDGVLYLQFFANSDQEATSADLHWYDGNKDRAIKQQIVPLDGCQFITARTIRSTNRVYTLIGEKCAGKGSSWRIIETNFDTGESSNLVAGQARGAFFTNAGSLDMWMLPDQVSMMIAIPNGLAADIVDLVLVAVADGSTKTIIRGVQIDQYPPSMPRRFQFSPDNTHLAFVTRDGDGGETLYVYNTTTPAQEPVKIVGGNRSSRVNGIAWTADSTRIFYAAAGDDNALFSTNVVTGESKLVLRGTFQNLAVSADGAQAASSEQIKVDTNDIRNNLILIDTANQAKIALIEGKKGESAFTVFGVK